LILDTEASGLPKRWDKPYSTEGNWPYLLQVSWIVYTQEQDEIKSENHFIKEDDITISKSATRIHGITKEQLDEIGKSRKEVLTLLIQDLQEYQPLVIGHFLELDFHLLAADFHRAGLENPLRNVPAFCTMVASTHFVYNPAKKYLRLCELYKELFNKNMLCEHRADEDARATALCFFELWRRGDIDEQKIEGQAKVYKDVESDKLKKGCALPLLAFIVFIVITCYLL
jgi:DNA polymerase-3 subunit epsilon